MAEGISARPTKSLTAGIRANWKQFSLLLLVNGFVGAMVGMERSILPLFAEKEFGITSRAVVLSFLVSFGLAKASSNLFAGFLADRWGRKVVLVGGWLAGLPVFWLLIFAPNWSYVVLANLFLGINQGLCWSMTVNMKIDLAGEKQRGLAMGLNESVGYLAVSFSALFTSALAARYGLGRILFYPALAYTLLGLWVSIFYIGDTHAYGRDYQIAKNSIALKARQSSFSSLSRVFSFASWKNRSLLAINQAGLINNLNDAVVWGLVPILMFQAGLSFEQIGLIAAIYPAIWGVGQLVTGAISDDWGRKPMVVSGLFVQAVGIILLAIIHKFWIMLFASVLLGLGTAMVYPTLIAAASDAAEPRLRATTVGVYRLWRDTGYLAGGLIAGYVADLFGLSFSILVIGGLTFLSGMITFRWMADPLKATVKNPPYI